MSVLDFLLTNHLSLRPYIQIMNIAFYQDFYTRNNEYDKYQTHDGRNVLILMNISIEIDLICIQTIGN